jgi:hypothetical protein
MQDRIHHNSFICLNLEKRERCVRARVGFRIWVEIEYKMMTLQAPRMAFLNILFLPGSLFYLVTRAVPVCLPHVSHPSCILNAPACMISLLVFISRSVEGRMSRFFLLLRAHGPSLKLTLLQDKCEMDFFSRWWMVYIL